MARRRDRTISEGMLVAQPICYGLDRLAFSQSAQDLLPLLAVTDGIDDQFAAGLLVA